MKFALVSNVLPPSETSHATVIHRLLRDFDPASYCLLSPREYVTGGQRNYSGWLPGKYYYLPPVFQLTRGYRLGLRLIRERVNLAMGIALRGWAIARILKREKCEALVVCTGGNEILDFPAGYLASRLVGARFYAYLLDQYFDMVAALVGKSFVQRLEPLLLKGASAVITPNEFLRDEIRRRYGIESVVIHNSCDLSVYEKARSSEDYGAAPGDGEVRIVYTGAVGIVHYDAFRNLMAAINLLDRKNVKLHLYTAQPRLDLEREGIHGQMVYHEHEPVSAMPGIQQQANILFLPLAFNSPYPEIVRTAAPGKMGELLAAGRPILVHAPADSFLSWYFRKHECGLVVDQNDPAALARAIETLLHDVALSERLSERARERAKTDFALPNARDRFARVLGFELPA